jgi:hypothetical protein
LKAQLCEAELRAQGSSQAGAWEPEDHVELKNDNIVSEVGALKSK